MNSLVKNCPKKRFRFRLHYLKILCFRHTQIKRYHTITILSILCQLYATRKYPTKLPFSDHVSRQQPEHIVHGVACEMSCATA